MFGLSWLKQESEVGYCDKGSGHSAFMKGKVGKFLDEMRTL
jgi:hypothetical protein